MSLIRKPNEIEVNPRIKALIYGQPGQGKTTAALSAPKPLLIDCDGRIHAVNVAHRADTVQVKSYDDILSVLNEDLTPYESIVIDTGGKLLDFMSEYVIKRNPKLGKAGGQLTLQGYGDRKGEFTNFCKRISMMNKHIIFVAHRQTLTENETQRYVPLFGGSSYDSLATDLDLIGYLEADGNERVITFNGTSRNDGKNTCNLPARMILPIVVDETGNGLANTFLSTHVITPYVNRLQKDVDNKKKYDELVSELKLQVEQCTDDFSLNDLVNRATSFGHIGNSIAILRNLITDKAKHLGFAYNKETKSYERVIQVPQAKRTSTNTN